MVTQKDNLRGIVCASISAAVYGLNPLFALPLYSKGMDAQSVLLIRYLLAAVMLAGYILYDKRESFRMTRQELLPQIGCGITMALSSLTLYLAYGYMDTGIASTLLFCYPLMVAVIMTLVYHEAMNKLTKCCLALAVIGVVVLNGGAKSRITTAGVLLSLAAAFTWCLYLIIMKKSPLRTKSAFTVTFYSLIIGAPVFVISLRTGLHYPPTFGCWGLLLLMAILPTIVAMVLAALAVRYVGPTITSIFGALEPLTAMIIGILVFSEAYSWNLFIGFGLIVLAVTLIACKK